MKRTIAIILSMILMLSMSVICASAAGESAEVYVTIADKDGNLAVAGEKITVTDADSDGALTISDVLYAAHEAFYEGGAAEGYATSVSQYGLGIEKLWGSANGGSYGYYVNNASAWALTDPVKDGDFVYAFVYTDLIGWSDNYSYFDSFMSDLKSGDEVTLTYLRAGYDESWNPVTKPVEYAVIVIDGKSTDVVTNAQGKATFTVSGEGRHIVTARLDTMVLDVLVAPVFVANVSGSASLIGDADSDGIVTIMDATAIQRTLALLPTQAYDPKAADADEDGTVTIMDATAIQRHLASLPTNENIGKTYEK